MNDEQTYTVNLLKKVLHYISEATDLLEKQYVLKVAEEDVKNYVKNMDKCGLFQKWWEDPLIKKEAKGFLKEPNEKSISTLKQDAMGSIDGVTYTIFFHLRCPSEYYYKTIKKRKVKYMVNKCMLLYMRLEKFNSETKQDEIVYEQGFASKSDDPNRQVEYIH